MMIKIPDTSTVVKKKTGFNTKIIYIENKIPHIAGLLTKINFNTKVTKLENKIPDISNFVHKIHLNSK